MKMLNYEVTMFGWTIIRGKENFISDSLLQYRNNITLNGDVYTIYQNHFPKFENDKVNYEDDDVIILLDGVIFNNHLLEKEYGISFYELLKKLYQEKRDASFVNLLRGSFNGFILDKKTNTLFPFTNHLGEREVFYFKKDDFLIISSNFNHISQALKFYKIEHKPDVEAVKSMIAYAHMVHSFTYIEGVTRLTAGKFLKIHDEEIKEIKYHEFNTNYDKYQLLSDDELIDIIEEKFIKAAKLEFDKDREYGYKSIIDISGGFDSRLVAFVAKKLGYEDVLTLSYSQTNTNEEKVVRLVMEKLDFDFYFKSMDYPSFLYEVSDVVRMNYGLTFYSGITGGKQMLEDFNHERLGIEHTGLLGDVYEGTFSPSFIEEKPRENKRYRYNKHFEYEISEEILSKYKNLELTIFQMRGLNFGLGTHLIRRNYNETFSPFMDVDVLDLMFNMTIKKRAVEGIYQKWMKKYYEEAADIIYAKTLAKHPASNAKIWLIQKIKVSIPYHFNNILRKLHLKKITPTKTTMNDFKYWYENNEKIRNFIDSYLKENLFRLNEFKGHIPVSDDILKISLIDKTIYMTVMEAMKQYFGDADE